jgi:hypothetical protein
LQGGRIIDPANNLDGRADVAVQNGRIAQVATNIDPADATAVIDATGLLVVPGLIDIHMHAYFTREPETISVMPDFHSFRSGVTTVVDTGTAGAKHFLHFKRTVMDTAKTRVLAFINIVKSGMVGPFEQDVDEMDPELAASIVLADLPGIVRSLANAEEPDDSQPQAPSAASLFFGTRPRSSMKITKQEFLRALGDCSTEPNPPAPFPSSLASLAGKGEPNKLPPCESQSPPAARRSQRIGPLPNKLPPCESQSPSDRVPAERVAGEGLG